MIKTEDDVFDYSFVGLGASNSLILIVLIREGLLKNKKVIIFEPDSKRNNDKTFCFWSNPNDPITKDLDKIISHRFNSIQVANNNLQKIDNQPYHYIRSIDLYNHLSQLVSDENIQINREPVIRLESGHQLNQIYTSSQVYNSTYVFDSRPPSYSKITKNCIYLNQSFFGFHIKCEKDVFSESSFEMMNFNVEQNKYTQFIYIIPFSKSEALVELTRFGVDKIDVNYAKNILDNFILSHFGKYTSLAEEIGNIPMTNFQNPPSSSPSILKSGTSANLIKPSTGYGFKNMYEFAQQVAAGISTNNLSNLNKTEKNSRARFRFYDELLLIILMKWPNQGKIIFTTLFQKQPIHTVFSFLDERTSLLQELKIFASLPIFPFLRALYVYLKTENWLRYILSFSMVICYFFISYWNEIYATYFSYLAILIGLLLVGIPHGALDYLLSKKKKSSVVIFILKYLGIILGYYLFWQIFPSFALVVFILYSSFHFGESELVNAGEKVLNVKSYFKAFFLGFLILTFLISAHFNESIVVISLLTNDLISIDSLVNLNQIALIVAIICFVVITIQTFLSRSLPLLGLLFILILGIKTPLIFAFAIYFIFQHSCNAWKDLKTGLNMSSIQLYVKSLPYTIGALCIFLLMAFYINKISSINGLHEKFFIFIACISFPHFILMHLFYKSEDFVHLK
jgi:lycopene beta-cyclase